MLLFLVRHARSKAPNNKWQTPNSKISEVGKKQAEILSKRSRFSQLDKIFSSDWERAKKTATIISKNLNVETELLDYIHEREQSPKMYGSLRNSKTSKKYEKEYHKNYGNLDWKFSNKEESIREVLKRTSKFSEFLIKNYKDKRILVISHDIFIKCFISRAILGKDYSDKTMARVINSLFISHTGISLLSYSQERKLWKIYYINDFSHLKYLANPKS